jgi:DNA-binding GntR family transcriptional regulator
MVLAVANVHLVFIVDYFRYVSCTICGMTAAGQPDPRAYMRLAAFIREQISDGKLAPGGRLPSIAVLRREQGHSRQTAGKAMRVLAEEGLIYRVPGLGYYVSCDVPAEPESSSP